MKLIRLSVYEQNKPNYYYWPEKDKCCTCSQSHSIFFNFNVNSEGKLYKKYTLDFSCSVHYKGLYILEIKLNDINGGLAESVSDVVAITLSQTIRESDKTKIEE